MILRAEEMTMADVPVRVNWINDPRVNRYMYFELPVTLESTTRWLERVSQATDRQDLVFKTKAGEPVGMAGVTAISQSFSNAEFYIFINPDMQGHGIGPAITSWMLDYAFVGLRLHKVYLYVDGENEGAVKLYEKLGFLKEGHLRQHRFKDGVFHDKLIYGMLAGEWLHRPRGFSYVEVTTPVAELVS